MPKDRMLPNEVIASRELNVVDAKEKVIVELGQPKCVSDTEAFCPYRFTFMGKTSGIDVHAVDAFQALQLALKTLPVELRHRESLPLGRMYWLEPGDDMGFSEADGWQ